MITLNIKHQPQMNPQLLTKVKQSHSYAMERLVSSSLDFSNLIDNGVLKSIDFELSNRLTRCAGIATTNGNNTTRRIKLSNKILSDNMSEVESTYLHELAHVLANSLYGKNQGHNANWVRMAKILGDSGKQYHNMKTTQYRKTKQATCDCKTWDISTRSHNKLKTHPHAYFCRTCKSYLKVVIS